LYNAQLNGKGHATQMSIESVEDEDTVYVEDFLRVIWRRLWVIALMAILFTGAAVGFSITKTPVYEASIKILVGQEQSSAGPVNLENDVQGLQQFTQTVAEIVPTRPVAEEVIRRLNLWTTPKEFLRNMSAERVTETQVVEVSYKDTDPERAQEVVNTIGEVFSEQVAEVSPSANAITATVWERAAVPDSPVSTNPLRNALLGLLLGGMLGLGLAFLLEYLDDSWRSPEEVEQVSGVPTFGAIRTFEVPRTGVEGEEN
jgi:capsular polysaccharide biosynthesis protein